jgi:hypothetical protein
MLRTISYLSMFVLGVINSLKSLILYFMVKGSIYTKRLGRCVAKQAKGTIGKYHVIPAYIGKWNVVAEGSVKPTKAFTTKGAAVTFAKRHASSVDLGEVVIHDTDGKILDRISC